MLMYLHILIGLIEIDNEQKLISLFIKIIRKNNFKNH